MLTSRELNSLKQLISRERFVEAVYLYGSVARGRQNQFSDVDLALVLHENSPPSKYSDLRLKVMVRLDRCLGRESDVVIFNEASPFLKYQILKYGKKIYERKGRIGRREEALGLMEYLDFQPARDFFMKNLLKRYRRKPNGR